MHLGNMQRRTYQLRGAPSPTCRYDLLRYISTTTKFKSTTNFLVLNADKEATNNLVGPYQWGRDVEVLVYERYPRHHAASTLKSWSVL